MSNDLKFTLRFDAQNKQFIGQIKQSGEAIDSLGSDATQAKNRLGALESQSNSTSTAMGSLKNQVLGLAGGFSVLFAAQQASERLSQYQDIRTQITSLVGSQEAWIETEQYLNQVAIEHNKTFSTLSGTYARLLSLENGGLITHQQTIALFEGMSNAQSANGATAEHLGNVMYGLQQAMASGTVRAEEFNQVTEPMPDLLIKLAQAANTTVGGLREMVNSGQLSSQLFGELLVKAFANYDGAAAKTANNISAQTALMTRAYDDAVKAFEQPIAGTFGVFAETTAQSLDLLAENADLVTTIVGVSLTAALGRGVAGMYSMAEAKLANIAAARSLAQAELASAQAKVKSTQTTVAQTQIEIKHLQALQLSNNQKFRAIGGETQLAAARARLTTVTAAATAAQASFNAVAATGSSVMALLGGPLGIAMMAAGAIGYFALANTDASKETGRFSESIESLLGQMDKLELKRLNQGLGERLSDLNKVELQIETLSKQRGTNSFAERSRQLEALRKEEAQLRKEVVSLEDEIYLIQSGAKSSNNTKPEDLSNPSVDDEANKMLANLQKQNALYGEVSNVAKLRYEIEHGALKGINAELEKKLLLEAKALDKKVADSKPKDTRAIDAFYEESDQLQTAFLRRLSMQASLESVATNQEKHAYEDRKAALARSFEAAYEQAANDQAMMDSLEREYFANRELLRAEHEMNLTQISRDADEERARQAAIVEQASLMSYQSFVGNLSNLMGQLSTVLAASGKESEGLFYATQALAMANAVINTELAASKALAYHENMTLAQALMSQQAVRAIGYASVGIIAGQTIAGQAHDGINRVPRENEGTWLLKANEMVLNPTQADNFRWMVDVMQQMQSHQAAINPNMAADANAMSAMMSQLKAASATAAYASAASGGVPVTINVTGVDKSQVKATASYTDGMLNIDMFINQAVEASMKAMYQDADNGGPVSKRIRKG